MTDLKLKKDATFITRINSRIKGAFAKVAKKEGISMAEYFERLLIKDLQQKDVEVKISEKIF